MGYSHHIYRAEELSADDFARFVDDVRAIVAHAAAHDVATLQDATTRVTLCGPDGRGRPRLTPAAVAFNGDGRAYDAGSGPDRSCEPFLLPRRAADDPRIARWRLEGQAPLTDEAGRHYTSLKTNQQPYDTVVVAALLAAAARFGDAIAIHTDYPDEQAETWASGRALYAAALGHPAAFVPVREDSGDDDVDATADGPDDVDATADERVDEDVRG